MARIFITGSSEGLGMMTGRLLVEQGHEVVLHARSAARAADAKVALPAGDAVVEGDVATLAGMRHVAEQANALRPFDAVIHNVGIGYREPKRIATAVQYEADDPDHGRSAPHRCDPDLTGLRRGRAFRRRGPQDPSPTQSTSEAFLHNLDQGRSFNAVPGERLVRPAAAEQADQADDRTAPRPVRAGTRRPNRKRPVRFVALIGLEYQKAGSAQYAAG